MQISFMAFGLNTLLNYLLIYGKFGFPRLEVRGSAIATLIARGVEVTVFLAVIYSKKMVPAAKIKEMLDLSSVFVKRFFHTTLPVILNESLWALGITMFSVVYAHMGTEVIAAINIAGTVERVAMVLFFGMAQACAVMVGNQIGASKKGEAFRYAKKFSLLGPLLGLGIGLSLILSANLILKTYHVSVAVSTLAYQIIFIFALTIPIRIF